MHGYHGCSIYMQCVCVCGCESINVCVQDKKNLFSFALD